MTSNPHDHIASLARAVADAQQGLSNAIREACPGPHLPVQHRDRRPAWCEVCGYAENGNRIKERQ